MKKEINQKILSDAPYNNTNSGLFLEFDQGGFDLFADLKNGTPTCYLISGYRGSGKSSFIKKTEAKIKASQNQEQNQNLVFIYLNFSKNESHGHLFRKLIRGLYLQLTDNNYSVDPLLEKLFQKTFYETSTSKSVSKKGEDTTEYSLDVMGYLKLLIGPLLLLFFILNTVFNFVQTGALVNVAGICFAAWDGISKIIKYNKSQKIVEAESESLDIKSLYDDEIADYHFLSILNILQKSYRIVFVFDEMDKIDSGEIDNLLKEMKPYLVSGLASFIVVAGQSLYYKYFLAKIEDDALLSSIFSKSIHIPLLSREQFFLLLKDKLLTDKGALADEEEQLLKSYVDSLMFESKRIPRKFISEIRKDIIWENEKAFLQIEHPLDKLSLFTKVIDVIEAIEDAEISPFFEPALQDLFVMQLYIKSHEILFSQKLTFTADDLKNPKQEGGRARWGFYMDRFLIMLLEGFEKTGLIEYADDNKQSYKLKMATAGTVDFKPAESAESSFVNELTELRSITNNISAAMFPPTKGEPMPFSKMLLKLEQSNAIGMSWKKKSDLLKMFDNLDNYLTDPGAIADIEAIIKEEGININKTSHDLFDFFGRRQAIEFFSKFGYQPEQTSANKIDLLLRSDHQPVKQIAFEFKFRRARPLPEKRLLLQSLVALNQVTSETKNNTHLIIVVFTHDKASSFSRQVAQFKKSIEESDGFEYLRDKVYFIPISTTSIHLLHQLFDSFTKEYIQNNFDFTFEAQPPPSLHPERNDHFVEKTFEFRKWDFTITIDPQETKYWRFGFVFSNVDRLPTVDEPRHNDNASADIHLCAGEPVNSDISQWSYSERLVLNNYHIVPIEDHYLERHDYRGQPITLRLFSEPSETITHLEIAVGGESRGGRSYDLSQYKYCTLSAWCDGQPFKLQASFKMNYKGL